MQTHKIICLILAGLCCTAAQLADNLIVSGSNRPFAEGVGTYGLPKRGEGGLVSNKMPSVMLTDRASGAYFANGKGNVTRYNTTADALLALGSFLGNDISRQLAAGRRLMQQPAAKLNTSDLLATGFAAARQYFAEDSQRQHKKGGLPTVSTQDGNFQIISNNDSGSEFQLAKDGTVTFVNGGLSPGIFSIGPNGVTLSKDNALGPVQAMAKAIGRVAKGQEAGGDGVAAGAAAPSGPGAGASGAAGGAASSLLGSPPATVAGSAGGAAPVLGSLPSAMSAAGAQQYAPVLGDVQRMGSARPSQAVYAAAGRPFAAATAAAPQASRTETAAGVRSAMAPEAASASGAPRAAALPISGTLAAQPPQAADANEPMGAASSRGR